MKILISILISFLSLGAFGQQQPPVVRNRGTTNSEVGLQSFTNTTATNNQLLSVGKNLQYAPSYDFNFTQLEGDANGRAIFDDRISGPTTGSIVFHDLMFTSYTNRVTNNVHARSPNMFGPIVVTQNFTRLYLTGNRIGMASIAGAGLPDDQLPALIYQLTGTNSLVDLTLNEAFDPFYDPTPNRTAGLVVSNITGIGTTKMKNSADSGIWWQEGDMYAHVHKMGPFREAGIYGLGINTTVTNEMYYTGDLVGGRVAMTPLTTNFVAWIDAKKILDKDADGRFAAFYASGGRNYLTGQKLEGWLGVGIDTPLGQASFNWVRELKISATSEFVSGLAGNLWLDVQTYEDLGTVTNGFYNNGAILFIGPGDANVSNGRGFTHVSGTSTLDGLHLNTSGTDSAANEPIFLAGSGMKVHNVVLTAPASANAVDAGSAQTLTVEGWLTANRALGANVTLTGPTNHTVNLSAHGPSVFDHNLVVQSLGKGLQIKEGSNAKQGVFQLNGTTAVVISTTAFVSTNVSRVWLTTQTATGTPGTPYVLSAIAGTSFSVKSTSGTDTSQCAWLITDAN